jgi:methylated-DNA-[protein]-cysteine S-methyltransferase
MANRMNSLRNPATQDNTVIFYTYVASPMGYLLLMSDGRSLTGLYSDTHARIKFEVEADSGFIASGTDSVRFEQNEEAAPFAMAREQLAEYFAGKRSEFSIPLAPKGTEFQSRVWQELCAIPAGRTISYGELARRVGNPNASRAVGLANGRNPISIVIPCHRVIGSDGSMTGYAGGLPKKEFLLNHELNLGRASVCC